MILISLPNAAIFLTYIQTVKMQEEGRAREREGGREGERLVHFPPFSKFQSNCFQPLLQGNVPFSSINEGKYVTMAALRKKWLIPSATDNKFNSVFCGTMHCFQGPGRRKISASAPQFLLVKYYFRGLTETKESPYKSSKYI